MSLGVSNCNGFACGGGSIFAASVAPTGAAPRIRAVSIVLLIVGLVFLYDLLWWRAGDRMLRPLPHGRRWRVPLGLFMGAQVLCVLWIVLGRVVWHRADAIIPTWLLIGTFVWHLLVLPATVIVWLLWASGRGVRALARRRRPAPQPALEGPPVSSRRQFLGAAVA